MSCPGCRFNFETSAARSPWIKCELFHASFVKVLDATNFGMLLNRSANPSGSFRPGQAAANPSYVTRPRRSASEAKVSSNLNFWVSSLQNGKLHFSGDSTTPSSDTNKVAAKVRVPGNRFTSAPSNRRPILQSSGRRLLLLDFRRRTDLAERRDRMDMDRMGRDVAAKWTVDPVRVPRVPGRTVERDRRQRGGDLRNRARPGGCREIGQPQGRHPLAHHEGEGLELQREVEEGYS